MTLDLSPDIRKSVLPERQRLLERLLLPLNRRLAADITLPIRTLDIDPPLLYEAPRYYHQHPQARGELATQDGLAPVQHGQFTWIQPAGR